MNERVGADRGQPLLQLSGQATVRHCVLLAGWCAVGAALLLIFAGLTADAGAAMGGPGSSSRRVAADRPPETSAVRLALLGAVRFFQRYISPTDGSRCGFSPTCSSFASRAVSEHGPGIGVLMTADRLIRCNPWKIPGTDYRLLPNGKLADPVANNTLLDQAIYQ